MADCFSLPNAAKLVDKMRDYADTADNNIYGICVNTPNVLQQAADAIEQLLTENEYLCLQRARELGELYGKIKLLSDENAKLNTERELLLKREIGCINCAYVKVNAQEYPCCDCSDYTHDKWEWCGLQEAE